MKIHTLIPRDERCNEIPPRSRCIRYGVFSSGGHLLADWDTSEQAGRFLYPNTDRYVAQVVDGVKIDE